MLECLGLTPASDSWFQLPDDKDPGRQQWWLGELGHCHSSERPGLSLLAPNWRGPMLVGPYGRWRNEPEQGRSLTPSLALR